MEYLREAQARRDGLPGVEHGAILDRYRQAS